jgi:hypothetical protein
MKRSNKRNSQQKLTIHHRKCKANGGTSIAKNISQLPRVKHEAWHTLTGHMHPDDIAILFNSHYLDPDYEFVCIKKS